MRNLRLAGCVLNQTPFDWKGNRSRIIEAIQAARTQEARVLCLPELSITGYGCEDAFFNPHLLERALEICLELREHTKGMAVAVGLPVRHRGVLFNTLALLVDGKLAGFIPKKSLAGDGVHYEHRWFKAWDYGVLDHIEIDGIGKVPFGDYHFDCGTIKIGFEICEEAWVAHRPGSKLAQKGVDIILNPSASHFAFEKLEIRKGFVKEGSRAFGVAYVYSNLLGNESGRIIFDGGVLIASEGKLIAQGPRFSYQDVQVTSATVDIDLNRLNRSKTASYQPQIDPDCDDCIDLDFKWPECPPVELQVVQTAAWEKSEFLKEEEFTRAVSIGLFDFLRKSQQSGFVISLSGGIDSAVVAILAAMSLKFAEQELGLDGLKRKLKYLKSTSDVRNLEDLTSKMVFCAYQSTQNSSEQTELAAKKVAEAIHASFYNWSIDSQVQSYTSLIAGKTGVDLNWKDHDIVLQNIQARVRGPAIWMLANLHNALLLATSNRSEAAVGYATMDGDTCGGISPIGGIDKAFLKHWVQWMMTTPSYKIEALSSVLNKAPTAELRPSSQSQTDEKDLMPYDVLDQIERLAIRDKRSPVEVFTSLKSMKFEYDAELMRTWVVKFFKLWCRNQWKRERYAPAFHLDDESLDPKTSCRFPVLSSGFEEEIAELQDLRVI